MVRAVFCFASAPAPIKNGRDKLPLVPLQDCRRLSAGRRGARADDTQRSRGESDQAGVSPSGSVVALAADIFSYDQTSSAPPGAKTPARR